MTTHSTTRHRTTGLARLISLIATVVFITLALLGLNFFFEGHLMKTAVVGIPAAAIMGRALITIGRCKAQRQGSQRSRERLAAITAIIIMALGSVCVSNFINVYTQRHEICTAMTETVDAMTHLDADYHTYADARIAAAPRRLRSTLTILLYPDRESDIWAERHKWLESLKDDNVWNVFMAANAHSLNNAATQWADEYAQVSAVILRDEPADCMPFAYDTHNSSLAAILDESQRFRLPDAKGTAAALALAALMLMSYAVTRRPKSDFEDTHR